MVSRSKRTICQSLPRTSLHTANVRDHRRLYCRGCLVKVAGAASASCCSFESQIVRVLTVSHAGASICLLLLQRDTPHDLPSPHCLFSQERILKKRSVWMHERSTSLICKSVVDSTDSKSLSALPPSNFEYMLTID